MYINTCGSARHTDDHCIHDAEPCAERAISLLHCSLHCVIECVYIGTYMQSSFFDLAGFSEPLRACLCSVMVPALWTLSPSE